jgi:hypothetical protein
MKSYKRLYHRVYAFANLLQAAESARKGKRHKSYVARFHFRRIFPTHRIARSDSIRHFVRKLRHFQDGYRQGEMGWEEVRQSVYSWIA